MPDGHHALAHVPVSLENPIHEGGQLFAAFGRTCTHNVVLSHRPKGSSYPLGASVMTNVCHFRVPARGAFPLGALALRILKPSDKHHWASHTLHRSE